MTVSPDDKVARASGVLGVDITDAHVLLTNRREYIKLEGVGRRVWELLGSPQLFDDLISTLSEEFDVEESTCRVDVSHFIEELHERGAVELSRPRALG